ncbi:hypothetical protein F0562_008604 [Nyssa sinensis]|uniref:Uncharacterized protein n=1 Tax=Nyssa sinensis TaxID=561372 RepID=A0A5J5ACG9_9ASTE|nr:hypothetical protein F0562_008604 [Nyssa sinensis]
MHNKAGKYTFHGRSEKSPIPPSPPPPPKGNRKITIAQDAVAQEFDIEFLDSLASTYRRVDSTSAGEST